MENLKAAARHEIPSTPITSSEEQLIEVDNLDNLIEEIMDDFLSDPLYVGKPAPTMPVKPRDADETV
jgi:hypothetical protein